MLPPALLSEAEFAIVFGADAGRWTITRSKQMLLCKTMNYALKCISSFCRNENKILAVVGALFIFGDPYKVL